MVEDSAWVSWEVRELQGPTRPDPHLLGFEHLLAKHREACEGSEHLG